MLREQKQPSDFFIYDNSPHNMGMSSEQKRFSDMRLLNGKKFDHGERSQGDQQAQQRMMQNIMTAHHTGGGVGLDGFKEPSLEDLVEMVREGKVGKEVLGDDADIFLKYGTPSQREEQLEGTGSLRIPAIPFLNQQQQPLRIPVAPNLRDTREGSDEDDLAFLKDFIQSRKG